MPSAGNERDVHRPGPAPVQTAVSRFGRRRVKLNRSIELDLGDARNADQPPQGANSRNGGRQQERRIIA